MLGTLPLAHDSIPLIYTDRKIFVCGSKVLISTVHGIVFRLIFFFEKFDSGSTKRPSNYPLILVPLRSALNFQIIRISDAKVPQILEP